MMRHKERHEPGSDDGPDPRQCDHVWRARAVTSVLADCECEVCDRCGALHIAESDEHGDHHDAAQGVALFPEGGVGGLDSLVRRWSPGGAPSSAD